MQLRPGEQMLALSAIPFNSVGEGSRPARPRRALDIASLVGQAWEAASQASRTPCRGRAGLDHLPWKSVLILEEKEIPNFLPHLRVVSRYSSVCYNEGGA